MPSRHRRLWYWALGTSVLLHALLLVGTSAKRRAAPQVAVHLEKVAAPKPVLRDKFVKPPPLRQQVLVRPLAAPRPGRALRTTGTGVA